MNRCEWTTLTAGSRCVYCGRLLKRDYDRMPTADCTRHSALGDATAQLLSGLGVTKDRVGGVLSRFGLPPDCGCAARQEWLNKVTDWWRSNAL